MDYTRASLRFRAQDFEPLPLETLVRRARVSLALVHLCIAEGCPTRRGRLSQATLLNWLIANHGQLRVAAGLAPLAPIDSLPPETTEKLRIANTMVTVIDFAESRTSNITEKFEMRALRRMVEQAVDR